MQFWGTSYIQSSNFCKLHSDQNWCWMSNSVYAPVKLYYYVLYMFYYLDSTKSGWQWLSWNPCRLANVQFIEPCRLQCMSHLLERIVKEDLQHEQINWSDPRDVSVGSSLDNKERSFILVLLTNVEHFSSLTSC